jgi:N-acetylmannosamine-6-phosphate 2-epimerase/N-acetylmannosamine kinase
MLLALASASLSSGCQVLRLQGVENIRLIKKKTGAPVIGLIKRNYGDSPVYITPTLREVDLLLELGCEVVALDGTTRVRPEQALPELIERIHAGGALAMADVDSEASASFAKESGADMIGTTLAGYTDVTSTVGPDLGLVKRLGVFGLPIIAEGRYTQRWQVESALRAGAIAVVVGGALNDPVKQTKSLTPRRLTGLVGAVDIGGTWLRFATFDHEWTIKTLERIPLPLSRDDRLQWIRDQVRRYRVTCLGVSTGGTVRPATGEVWEAKPIIPDHQGSIFSEETLGVPTIALNDGLASAWGHACHRENGGKRVVTLALGTGVGCGCCEQGRVLMGHHGEYPRINDLPGPGGQTYEDLMGGASLSPEPTDPQKRLALRAISQAVDTVRAMYQPDTIVVCGGVGLSPWMTNQYGRFRIVPSPFGDDAGLYGAAALAIWPPDNLLA